MQNHVNCIGSVIAPRIFYSDQTSQFNIVRANGYPLVISLGNIACELRLQAEGHMLLGVLPVISAGDIPSHHRQLEIFHECLQKILHPLKKLSYRYRIICLQCMYILSSFCILDTMVFNVYTWYYFEEQFVMIQYV